MHKESLTPSSSEELTSTVVEASFGLSGKHIFRKFGAFSNIKVRFAGVLFPGETLVTEMWKEGDRVIFQTKCKERGTLVLGAAAATLAQ